MARKTLALLISISFLGCSNYKFGDPSIKYCQAATPELRLAMKEILESNGIVLSVDYCSTVGLVDLMIDTQDE
jgi:hypothetical protein